MLRFIENITDFIFVEDKPEPADIIFIPGGTLPEIAETAAMLYQRNLSPLVLPSGRYSITRNGFFGPETKKDLYHGSYQTEWEFLKDVLLKNGVPESAILKEDCARYTYENAILSKEVVDQKKLGIRKAILCPQAYHARRALMYYEMVFPEIKFFVCPTKTNGIGREQWYKTKEGISKVMGELEKCSSQFTEILQANIPEDPDDL